MDMHNASSTEDRFTSRLMVEALLSSKLGKLAAEFIIISNCSITHHEIWLATP